eukprot:scaffold8814_cov69-Phaeocystis_antarctica.AAC.2
MALVLLRRHVRTQALLRTRLARGELLLCAREALLLGQAVGQLQEAVQHVEPIAVEHRRARGEHGPPPPRRLGLRQPLHLLDRYNVVRLGPFRIGGQ